MSISLATAIVYSPDFNQHIPHAQENCVEKSDRCKVIFDSLNGLTVLNIQPTPASDAELLLCHTQEYIDTVKKECAACSDDQVASLSTDPAINNTLISKHSFNTAQLAVGAATAAVDAVMTEKAQNAFCIVRPPGHHAACTNGMGFCLFNTVAIAARYIQTHHSLNKILIIDWDAHHGNGTEEIFKGDDSVLYFSMHQAGLYTQTGAFNITSTNSVNIPVTPNQKSRERFTSAIKTYLKPKLLTFKPDFILISCGFDALEGDPTARLNLKNEDFRTLTRQVMLLTGEHTRIVSILEGGYRLDLIGQAARAHVEALMERQTNVLSSMSSPRRPRTRVSKKRKFSVDE